MPPAWAHLLALQHFTQVGFLFTSRVLPSSLLTPSEIIFPPVFAKSLYEPLFTDCRGCHTVEEAPTEVEVPPLGSECGADLAPPRPPASQTSSHGSSAKSKMQGGGTSTGLSQAAQTLSCKWCRGVACQLGMGPLP